MKWETIDKAPKDGICILLYYHHSQYGPDVICEGWWFSSPKGIDDGWETSFGFIGEPTHFCYISFDGII